MISKYDNQLNQKYKLLLNICNIATGWNRTNDTQIFSLLLYQLSYSGSPKKIYTNECKMSSPMQKLHGAQVFEKRYGNLSISMMFLDKLRRFFSIFR